MINVVVSGCNGAMGRVLTKAIEEMEDITIVAGIDKNINSYKNPNTPVITIIKQNIPNIVLLSNEWFLFKYSFTLHSYNNKITSSYLFY